MLEKHTHMRVVDSLTIKIEMDIFLRHPQRVVREIEVIFSTVDDFRLVNRPELSQYESEA